MQRTTALVFSTFASMLAHAAPPASGLRFDSPRVVDLSSRQSNFDASASAVPVIALDADAARAIVAATAAGEGDPLLPFTQDRFGCDDDACTIRGERALIDAEAGAVMRKGTTLVVTTAAGAPAHFVDFHVKPTAQADGDSTRHRYLGRVGPARLLHVGVDFGHDSPGAFLVGAKSGKIIFVHNGGDVSAFAPDARRLVMLNTLNSPAAVAVSSLDDDGPTLTLACTTVARDSRVLVDFKGWRDADRFDLALKRGDTVLPLRVERTPEGWRMAAPDPSQLATAWDGFACRAAG